MRRTVIYMLRTFFMASGKHKVTTAVIYFNEPLRAGNSLIFQSSRVYQLVVIISNRLMRMLAL